MAAILDGRCQLESFPANILPILHHSPDAADILRRARRRRASQPSIIPVQSCAHALYSHNISNISQRLAEICESLADFSDRLAADVFRLTDTEFHMSTPRATDAYQPPFVCHP